MTRHLSPSNAATRTGVRRHRGFVALLERMDDDPILLCGCGADMQDRSCRSGSPASTHGAGARPVDASVAA